MSASSFPLEFTMQIRDEMSAGASSASSSLNQVGQAAQQADQATGNLQTRVVSTGEKFSRLTLGIGAAASGVLNLVRSYTGLQVAQLRVESMAVREARANSTLDAARTKLNVTIAKYGANSAEAAAQTEKVRIAEDAAKVAAERHDLAQTNLNQRMADFAISIVPSAVSIMSGLVQTFDILKTRTAGAGVGIRGIGIASKEASVGVRGLGISMKTALIGTGIGIILVTLGSLLAAFATNWLGIRDAVNAAGAAIGEAYPKLKPLLDVLTNIGKMLTGDFIPGTEEAAAGIDKIKEATDAAGKALSQFNADAVGFVKTLAAMDKKERNKELFNLGIKGGAGKRMKGFLKDLNTVFTTLQNFHHAIETMRTLNILTKLGFDVPASVFKKIAFTFADRFKELGKMIKGNDPFEEFAKVLQKNAKKGGPALEKAIAEFFNTHPDFKAALEQLDPDLSKALSEWMGTIPATVKKAQPKGLRPGDFLVDAILGTGTTGGGGNTTTKTAEEKAKEQGKKIGEAVRQGINDGLAIAGTSVGMVGEGLFDLSFEAIFGTTPEAKAAEISDDVKWALSFIDIGDFNLMDTLFPAGDPFGGLDLNTIISGWLDTLFNVGTWQKAIVALGNPAFWKSVKDDLNNFILNNLSNVEANKAMQAGSGGIGSGNDAFDAWRTKWLAPLFDVGLWQKVLVNLGTGKVFKDIWDGVVTIFSNNLPPATTINPTAPRTGGMATGNDPFDNFRTTWLAPLFDVGLWQTVLTNLGTGKVFTDIWAAITGYFNQHMAGATPTTPTPTPPNTGADKAPAPTDWVNWQQTVEGKIGFVWIKATAFVNYINTAFTSTIPVALQKSQTAFANLSNQGIASLNALGSASSQQMSGLRNNLSVGAVAAQKLQSGLANLSNQGANSLKRLASASSSAMSGMKNNLSVGAVASQKLQTGLANLSNQGANAFRRLASASSSAMNGLIHNVQAAQRAVISLVKSIGQLKSKSINIHVGLSGPGVSYLGRGGSITRFAAGGLLSAAGGTAFTTHGPQLVLAGDNPGGKETVAFIPHNDPGPTMKAMNKMFGHGSNQPIIVQVFLGEQQIKNAVTRMIVSDQAAYR